MGADSLWHWIIVIAIVLLLFGRGRVSELMGDVANGIKGFKKAMAAEEMAKDEDVKTDPPGLESAARDPGATVPTAERPAASREQ